MLKFSRVALSSSTRKHKDNHPVEFVVPGQTSLIPPRWRDERTGGLIPKRTAEDFSYSEFSDRTWKPQLQFVDTRPVPTPRAQWEEERILFDAIERPIIQLAFDKPEAIGMHLKDCVIQGLHVAMTESYLAKVVHWVKEARYWRCIGVYHPFYHPYRLRVHVWRWDYVPGTDYEKGPILGSPLITQPMKDAILDLEKAYRRHQAGLDPAYKWSDWSPCGKPDGSMNDWLPRLPSMRWDPDPDGITATEEDIDFLIRSSYNSEMPNAIHDVMKQRYGFLIYQSKNEDSNPFVLNAAQAGCGRLEVRDFDFPPVSPNLLECSFFVAYCAMMGYTPRETLYDAPTQAAVQKLMSENTEKVEAMRLFRSSSTDLQWIRTYLEEKASLSSFDQTPDRVLTSILIHMYEAMQRIVSKHEPWGKALAQATTLSEYKEAVGPVAYDVAMMLQHANQERIREKWSTRFRSDSSEEKMLDNLLVKMSQRTNPAEPGNIGSTFDREKEPIGRNTQRRIMAHDTGKSSDVKFWEKTRKGTRSSDESSGLDDNVYSTQFK